MKRKNLKVSRQPTEEDIKKSDSRYKDLADSLPQAVAETDGAGNTLRILIVEDSEDDASLLLRTVSHGGYDVVQSRVVDTPAAMRAALESQDWDIITSDHAMPQFSALEALALTKELRPNVPFLILSGKIDLKRAIALMKEGAHDYIDKRELSRVVLVIERELREAETRRERQQAKEELVFNNIILRTQQETSIDGILVVDENGKISSFNQRYADMWGIPPDVIESRSGERARQSIMEKLANPEEFSGKVKHLYEVRDETSRDEILLKDGRSFDRYSAPMLSADGKYYGRVWYFRDITDRKQAEGKLKQQIDAMEASIDGIAILNEDQKYVYINRAHARIYGYDTAEELIGQTWSVLYDEVELRRFDHDIMPEFSRKGQWRGEARGKKKDGSAFFQDISLTAMDNGGLICVVHNITDRKQTEEKLALNFEIQAAMNILLGLSLEDRPVKEFLYRALDLVLSLKWLAIESKGAIFLTDKAGETLHLQAQKGLSKELCVLCKTVPYGHCLCGRAAASRAVQFADHVEEHHETRYEGMLPHGHYCVPIFSGDHVLGVIVLYIKEGHIRSPREEDFLKAVANSLAGTIEHRQAEKELRDSEERFKRIFDEGPFGMGLESPDHTIIAVNKVLCELLGYTEPELIGKNVTDITCEEDRIKSKEVLGQLFANSIPVFRMEKRYIKKDGDILWANASISAVHGQDGNVLYGLAIIEDLTESRKAAEKIHLLAYYDSLTGLPNRTFHKELMKRAIEHANRHKEIFALIYIGLDNFQRINDSLGYSIGDLLLKAIADRLTNSLRKSDYVARSDEGEAINTVSRVGGDEFIVLAQDISQTPDAAIMSRRLLEEMSVPYDLNGREVFLTVSIGISLYPDDGTDVDELLKNAEKAMRHTKSEGKNSYHFYSSSMQSSVLEALIMESDLHKALERNELVLYYQPKVDATTRMVKGMEALIRWIHPDKGLISPMQFIPLAETSGLIIPIGEFVIRTVCRQIKTWQEAGYKQMAISLNVSGIQFDKQNLIEIVKDALQDTMISSQCLELEITESVLMRNPEKAIRILTGLEAMGIGILIDDFGTGYSSLSYLKRLPALDFLKIDQSFVKGLASDPRDQAIVRATIAMAHSLNLKTIAEGVETQEQLSFLQEHGCDEIQGYFFSKPLPAEDIPGILAKGYL